MSDIRIARDELQRLLTENERLQKQVTSLQEQSTADLEKYRKLRREFADFKSWMAGVITGWSLTDLHMEARRVRGDMRECAAKIRNGGQANG